MAGVFLNYATFMITWGISMYRYHLPPTHL